MKIADLVKQSKEAAVERGAALEAKAKKLLLSKTLTLNDLANALPASPKEAQAIVAKLQADGLNIHLQEGELSVSRVIAPNEPLVVKSKDFFDGEWVKFGACGDNHLANKHARLDVLHALYDIYEREGVTKVFNTGNVVDGECRFNKYELLTRSGFEPQMEYFANEYPHRKGIETFFITGEDHEGWWSKREGINVGKRMEDEAKNKGRTDLKWIGHVERDIQFKAKNGFAWGRVTHPGGGSAYAVSYTEQKIVEALQGGEKPHFMLIGHYHKFNQGYPREVNTVQTGCTCDQTAFLRRQKIRVDVGGTIVKFHQADTGEINRFQVEWFPFFDRKFYDKNNKYQTW